MNKLIDESLNDTVRRNFNNYFNNAQPQQVETAPQPAAAMSYNDQIIGAREQYLQHQHQSNELQNRISATPSGEMVGSFYVANPYAVVPDMLSKMLVDWHAGQDKSNIKELEAAQAAQNADDLQSFGDSGNDVGLDPKRLAHYLEHGNFDLANTYVKTQEFNAKRDGHSGTPGQYYIPPGAKHIQDPDTHQWQYQLSNGGIIPDTRTLTQYQENITDPDNRGAIARAVNAEKIGNVTLGNGAIVPARMGNAVKNTPLNYQQPTATPEPGYTPTPEEQLAIDQLNKQHPAGQQIGQSTADKYRDEATGKASGAASAGINNRVGMYNQIIHEANMGISALKPVTDPVTKMTTYGVETGGQYPAIRGLYNNFVTNAPGMRDIETAASMKSLQSAQDYLKGEGAVSDAERQLISMSGGIDPYKYDSAHNHMRFIEMRDKAMAAKEAAIRGASGDFSLPTQQNQPGNNRTLPHGAEFIGFK